MYQYKYGRKKEWGRKILIDFFFNLNTKTKKLIYKSIEIFYWYFGGY